MIKMMFRESACNPLKSWQKATLANLPLRGTRGCPLVPPRSSPRRAKRRRKKTPPVDNLKTLPPRRPQRGPYRTKYFMRTPTRPKVLTTDELEAQGYESCRSLGLADPAPLGYRRADQDPRWLQFRGWWRIWRGHAAKPRECGCCQNCRHFTPVGDKQGWCGIGQGGPVGVLCGDWCGGCAFTPPAPGDFVDAPGSEPEWPWPSRTWKDNLGAKRCRSCTNCAYSVRLNHSALCRWQAPTAGQFGPEWRIVERTAEVCEHAVFSRPKHWPFN